MRNPITENTNIIMKDEIIDAKVIDGIIVINLIVDKEKKRVTITAKSVLKLLEKL
jgi:hypothetical protein